MIVHIKRLQRDCSTYLATFFTNKDKGKKEEEKGRKPLQKSICFLKALSFAPIKQGSSTKPDVGEAVSAATFANGEGQSKDHKVAD